MRHKKTLSANLDMIVRDRRNGSAQIAHDFLELMIFETHSNTEINEMCKILCDAYPSMALIHNITDRLIKSERNKVLVANKLLKKLDDADSLIATKAQEILPTNTKVLTISQSRTINQIFKKAKKLDKNLHIFISFGYPEKDGHEHAKRLAKLGFKVTAFPDLAYGRFIQSVDLVIVGADQSSEDMFVNRTGTLALALLAKRFNKPFYVAATRMKEIQTCDLYLEESELNKDGVNQIFPVFDLVSNDLVTGGFIGEDG